MTSQQFPRFLSMGAAIVTSLFCGRTLAQLTPGDPIQHQFVVTLLPGQNIAAFAADYDATVVGGYPARDLYLLQTPVMLADCDLEYMMSLDDRLLQVEQNSANAAVWGNTQSFFVQVAPANYETQELGAFLRLDITRSTATGAGVTVAVLDTGTASHPLLGGVLREDGYNFVDGNTLTGDVLTDTDSNANNIPDELYGHGTFVSGIISLIAPGCRILPVKVLDSDGMGSSFSVAAGIYYAIDHGARVINLSLSTTRNSPTIATAVTSANAAGVVLVGAVGNDAHPFPCYPAALPEVIAVTATDMSDRKCEFADYGTFVSLSAPGQDLVSTSPDGSYSKANGTSFAAAVVSGTAALCASMSSTPLPPSNIRSHLLNSSVNIDNLNPDYRQMLGRGRVSPLAAVRSYLIRQQVFSNSK